MKKKTAKKKTRNPVAHAMLVGGNCKPKIIPNKKKALARGDLKRNRQRED
ncbi:MAG: hypothetical protein FWD15_01830 [Alphaproteobacteria bacterium]|nr:hypothetical protein [Alphaproteobacteria bacterium]